MEDAQTMVALADVVGAGRGSKSNGLAVAQILLLARHRYCAVVLRLRWPSSN
jgi:hypothetical protein